MMRNTIIILSYMYVRKGANNMDPVQTAVTDLGPHCLSKKLLRQATKILL